MLLRCSAAIGALSTLLLAGAARAEPEIFTRDTLHGEVDLRLAAADGEASFVDGGFGKTRFGGDADGGWRGHAVVAQAALEWNPRLNWEWSAVVDVTAQNGQSQAVDLMQAYVLYKPVPRSATRFEGRAGLFYPPISLEHDGKVWGLTNVITPSAINSWVGEEVKVLGVEAGFSHDFGDQAFGLTGGLFTHDDTAGTLLTYRGWALHDIKSTAHGDFPLPPLSAFGAGVQKVGTSSVLEVDHQIGFYGRAEWRPTGPLTLSALYYDNRGDEVGVTDDVQWAWKTTFTNAGLSLKLGEHTRLLAQAMWGRTVMGFPTPDGIFADVVFRSAYASLSHEIGPSTLTGRVDLFDVHDHSVVVDDNNDESGWALTAAWRRALSEHADVRLEALHVNSDRPSRALAGDAPRQSQTLVQSSFRLSF